MKEPPTTLTAAEVAKRIGVTPGRVRQMVQERRIAVGRFGNALAIPAELLPLFERRKEGRPRKAEST